MNDDEWEKTQQWLKGGAPAAPAAPPAPSEKAPAAEEEPGIVSQLASGAARGAYSNVAGLETAASKIPGMSWMAPYKSTEDWINRPDKGGWETAGRIGGEYGPLMIPGLDAPEGLGLLGKLAVNAVKGGVGGAAATGDKEGAQAGAASSAGSTIARTAGKAALSALPAPVRWLGDKAMTVGGIMAAENMMKGRGHGGGSYIPYWYIGHSLPHTLAALAALALGAPPAAQGRAGATLWKGVEGEPTQ